MTKKLVSFDDQAEPGQGLPAAVKAELNNTYGDKVKVDELATEAETGRLSQAALDTMYSKYQPGGMVGPSVQGLYERTKPAPSSSAAGLHALKADPTVAGRIWCQGLDFGNIGYTDDGGATFVGKTAFPGTGGGQVWQIAFSDTYMWALCGANANRNGQLFRSPLPDASGNGIVWTKMFDLADPPNDIANGTPIVTGDQSWFRPQCLFVAQMHIYLLEYGGTITGGPSLYCSGSHGGSWTKAKTFTDAKHGHAIRFISDKPTVMLGDGLFNGIGLYRSTTLEGTGPWARISQYGGAEDGNTLYGINFFPITVAGKQMIVSEYDGALNYGPIFYPHHGSDNQKWPLLPAFQLPPQYFGTMRSLTLTPDGNLMWVHTAENGLFGPNETVWISKPPFTAAVLLDSFPSGTMFLGEPVIDGDHVWFGYYRCRAEKFLGQ